MGMSKERRHLLPSCSSPSFDDNIGLCGSFSIPHPFGKEKSKFFRLKMPLWSKTHFFLSLNINI
jgi:hypothetical protein